MFLKHITPILICCSILVVSVCSWLLFISFHRIPVNDEFLVCGNAIVANGTDSSVIDGKVVFQTYCAVCHNPIKDATGPALANISSVRSKEWICKFITSPKFMPKDRRAKELQKTYGRKCMKFPKLTCKDIEEALSFVEFYRNGIQ